MSFFLNAISPIAGHWSASCGKFGYNLNVTNPPTMADLSYYSQSGTYFGVGSPLQCDGNATRWNVCYFPTIGSTSATLAVYRQCTVGCGGGCGGRKCYTVVSTTTISASYQNSNATPPGYICISNSSTPFKVMKNDILVGCIQQNALHIAAKVPGSSVYYNSGNLDCSSQIKNDNNQPGLTLLISLGMSVHFPYYIDMYLVPPL